MTRDQIRANLYAVVMGLTSGMDELLVPFVPSLGAIRDNTDPEVQRRLNMAIDTLTELACAGTESEEYPKVLDAIVRKGKELREHMAMVHETEEPEVLVVANTVILPPEGLPEA